MPEPELSVPGSAEVEPVPAGRGAVPGAVLARRASIFGRCALRNVSDLLRVVARALGVIGAVLLGSVVAEALTRPCGIAELDADLVPGAFVAVPDVANVFVPTDPPARVPVRLRW